MIPNIKYKTTFCRNFEQSNLKIKTMPTRTKLPLRARSPRTAQTIRRSLKSLFPKKPQKNRHTQKQNFPITKQ